MEFHKFNFHPQIAAAIKAAGFVTPTPIQEQALPRTSGERRHGHCPDWNRQNSGLRAADTGAPDKQTARPYPRPRHCTNARAGRADQHYLLGPQRQNAPAQHHDLRRRRHKPADTETARRRRDRRRLPRTPARSYQSGNDKPFGGRSPRAG